MHLETLNIEEFKNFANNHPLANYYETINYAMLMAENGYDYEFIGLKDYNNNIKAASLILFKPIGIKCFYGYAPRGFLIDYEDTDLLNTFTTAIKKYYYQKNVIFIKINPYLSIGEINKKDYTTNYNSHQNIVTNLINLGYKKLADNLYFEAMLPRFNAIIDLKNFNNQDMAKNTKNKIKKGIRKGLTFEKKDKEDLINLEKLIQNKNDIKSYYYYDYYTVFNKENNIDFFLVSINYDDFLKNSQYIYNVELNKNNYLNSRIINKTNEKYINAKMASDKNLLTYKNDIMEATKGLQENRHEYLAGALVIKYNKTVSIAFSAYNNDYKRFAPNYFLYYNLIKYYQNDYDYLDLNGVVGNFTTLNPYTGLNRFKLGFNPNIYEFIGEFDLIIEPKSYNILLKNGILAKEFNKKN